MKAPNKHIIITGCPRSGTGYAAAFFRHNGIDVGHEEFGKHGISSWCLAAADNNSVWGPSFTEVKEKYKTSIIFHQVRNPIDTISSLMTINHVSYSFMSKYMFPPCDGLEWCMYAWLQWNIMAEKIAEKTYRVEDIAMQFPELEIFDNKKYNSRKKQKYSAQQMLETNQKLWEKICSKANHYGYELKN